MLVLYKADKLFELSGLKQLSVIPMMVSPVEEIPPLWQDSEHTQLPFLFHRAKCSVVSKRSPSSSMINAFLRAAFAVLVFITRMVCKVDN